MITLSKSGNAVKFTFDENDHYLQNGTIEVPVNSLALIMDDSDMVTFRKSASNDIFVSANYDDFGMSKADLIEWFKVNAFAAGGGSSIVEIYVGTSADTINPQTGVIDKKEGKKDWLNIAWKSDQGEYSLTKINLNEFILEEEFASGITSDSGTGIVYGVVDKRANNKVYTAYDASGNPISSGDVLTVGESGFTTNNVQTAIDEKSKATVKKVGEKMEYIWDSTQNKMVLRVYDELSVKINDIEFFVTDNDGHILLPNVTF